MSPIYEKHDFKKRKHVQIIKNIITGVMSDVDEGSYHMFWNTIKNMYQMGWNR